MKTIQASIKAWKMGNKYEAYQLYLEDEGSYGLLDFTSFCENFGRIVKRHDENLLAELHHSKINQD